MATCSCSPSTFAVSWLIPQQAQRAQQHSLLSDFSHKTPRPMPSARLKHQFVTVCHTLYVTQDKPACFSAFGISPTHWPVDIWSFQIVSQASPLANFSPSPTAKPLFLVCMVTRYACRSTPHRKSFLTHDPIEFFSVLPTSLFQLRLFKRRLAVGFVFL